MRGESTRGLSITARRASIWGVLSRCVPLGQDKVQGYQGTRKWIHMLGPRQARQARHSFDFRPILEEHGTAPLPKPLIARKAGRMIMHRPKESFQVQSPKSRHAACHAEVFDNLPTSVSRPHECPRIIPKGRPTASRCPALFDCATHILMFLQFDAMMVVCLPPSFVPACRDVVDVKPSHSLVTTLTFYLTFYLTNPTDLVSSPVLMLIRDMFT